jgi:hypothetical protein
MHRETNNIIAKLRSSLGLTRAGRDVTVLPDDVFIVSYPRSGNTWMRFLLGNLFFPDERVTFANLEKRVPDIHQNTDRYLQRIPSPRILKSHEYYDPRYGTVVYLVRDPREVCISYYYYHVKFRKIDEKYSMDRFVARFLSGELDPYRSWGEHVHDWLEVREGTDNFLLIRYEDILTDFGKTVRKIAEFLPLNWNQALLASAIERSSFDTMQRLEKQQFYRWKMLRKSRRDMMFIRKGQRNSWKRELSSKSKELIEKTWPSIMERLGYQILQVI